MNTKLIQIFFILLLTFSCNESAKVSKARVSTLSPISGNVYDFGYTPLASVKSIELTLENSGDYKLTNLSTVGFIEGSAFSFKGDAYPGSGGTCEKELEVGAQCVLSVSFSPTASGFWEEELSLSFLNGVSDDSKELRFLGISGERPEIEIESESGSFGILEVYEKKQIKVSVINTSELPIRELSFDFQNQGQIHYLGGAFPGVGGNCSDNLEGNERCDLMLSFEPIENRSHRFDLQVNWSDYIEERSVTASFTGQSLEIIGKLFFNGVQSLNFGTNVEETKKEIPVQIRNEGLATSSQIGVDINHPDFSVQENRCPDELAPANQCEVILAYEPKSPNYWSQSGSATITYHNGKVLARSPSIDLLGRATMKAELSFENPENPATKISQIDFGKNGQNSESIFLVDLEAKVGTSTTAEQIQLPSLSSPFALEYTTCQSELSSGGSCSLAFSYKPVNLGSHQQNFNISYFNGKEVVTSTLSLRGESQASGLLKISELNSIDNAFNFGLRPNGSSKDYEFTLSNPGIVATTNISPPALPASMSYAGGFPGASGTCPSATPFTLSAGSSCKFSITYSPASTNYVEDELYSFSFFDGISTLNYQLSLSYSSTSPGKLEILDPSDFSSILETDFGAVSIDNSEEKTIKLKNTGGFRATQMSYSISDAKFQISGGDCPGNGGALEPNAECTMLVSFNPDQIESLTETLSIGYENALTSDTLNHTFEGSGQNLAFLEIDPNGIGIEYILLPNAVYPGGESSQLFTVTNNGQVSATSLSFSNIIAPLSIGGNTTCGASLNAGDTCVYEVLFNPTFLGFTNSAPKLSYNNGNEEKSYSLAARAVSKTATVLQAQGDASEGIILPDTEINKTKTAQVAISNSGTFSGVVTGISSSSPFLSVSSENCTTGKIHSNRVCNISVQFSPDDTVIGQTVSAQIDINYDDGLSGNTLTLDFSGEAIAPNSSNKGWTKVLALGETVNYLGQSTHDAKVTLAWNDMEPSQAYTIQSYNVYRKKPEDESFDFESPIGSGILTTEKTYTDEDVEGNTHYIYHVRPVILGEPSVVEDEYSSVEVFVPPENMSFIHRRMANKALCGEMNKTVDIEDSNSCVYAGRGSNEDGRLDIAKHILYDRYEIGTNGSSQPGQTPREDFVQYTLAQECFEQEVIIGEETIQKRVPSRLEYQLASTWPAGINIEATELGVISSENCNSTADSTELNNKNENCVSEFGIYNLIGNAWEIVAERMAGGIAPVAASQKLYDDLFAFDDLNINSIPTSDVDETECVHLLLGHPMSKVSGFCPEGSVPSQDSRFNSDGYWHPSSFNANFAQGFAGGSYDPNTKAGRYTTAWVPQSYKGGGRCLAYLPEGQLFPPEED